MPLDIEQDAPRIASTGEKTGEGGQQQIANLGTIGFVRICQKRGGGVGGKDFIQRLNRTEPVSETLHGIRDQGNRRNRNETDRNRPSTNDLGK